MNAFENIECKTPAILSLRLYVHPQLRSTYLRCGSVSMNRYTRLAME